MPSGTASRIRRQRLQKEAVYGLTEFYRERDQGRPAGGRDRLQRGDRAICAAPLIRAGIIDLDEIIIDLKTGVSGAGRSLKENLLHAELSEGSNCLCRRRHASASGGIRSGVFPCRGPRCEGSVHTAPVPANRGILGTVYVKGDARRCMRHWRGLCRRAVSWCLAVRRGRPSTRHVRGSNFVHLGVPATA